MRDARGASIVEFAIVLPFLILCIAMLVDVGTGISEQMRLKQAAQAGVNYAIDKGFDADKIIEVVRSSTDQPDIVVSPAPSKFCACALESGLTEQICSAKCSSGNAPAEYVRVSTTFTHRRLIALPGLDASYTLVSESRGRLK
ncbi:TadE/TadG family type IV pilus assembly protein [Sphingomonas floccifaciens]|uniref:TadE/TadG family type IV pilus assembly protein n=1 Tax=Sphingomonas floccifaciens TaxID=1844115 RepID=UPI0036D400AD